MPEAAPIDSRPAETPDGKIIVYTFFSEHAVSIDCPAFGFGIKLPRPCYSQIPVENSLGTILRCNAQDILRRSVGGEQFPEETLQRAARCANGTKEPFVHMGEPTTTS